MKKSALLLPCLLLSTVAWTSANAQSCASPQVIASNSTFSGDTSTGGDLTITSVCGGASLSGPVEVFTWANGGGPMSGNIVVTPTNATFDVGLALGDGANCAAAALTCDGSADNGAGGAAETLSVTGLTLNRTYFLFVSSFASGAANVVSGPFNGTTPQLPVKLQSFSIN